MKVKGWGSFPKVPNNFGVKNKLAGMGTYMVRSNFTPANLFAGGVQGAWYDASDFSTMFQDAAGTTPVTAVGQPVGKMLDKSGRGNHIIQGTATSRPILAQDADGIYLPFDGIDDTIASAAAINLTGTNKVTVFLAMSRTKASQAALMAFGQLAVNTGAFEIDAPVNSVARDGLLINNDTTAGTVAFNTLPTIIAGTRTVLTGTFDRSQAGIAEMVGRVNSVQQVPVSYTGVDSGSANFGNHTLTFGCRPPGTIFFVGRLYQAIIRASLSTDAEMIATEKYIGAKMNLVL